MQVVAVQRTDIAQNGRIDAMHRLRSRVFGERLHWQVQNRAGLEIDEFDAFNPTYLLALTGGGYVAGCVRLLPATGPTMLETTFPELLADGRLKAHPGMVESSRFCGNTTDASERDPGDFAHDATRSLFAGIIEWCMASGYTEIVTATDLRIERLLRRIGWPMRRLGAPQQINETVSIAGILNADRQSFDRLRPATYASDFSTSSTSRFEE